EDHRVDGADGADQRIVDAHQPGGALLVGIGHVGAAIAAPRQRRQDRLEILAHLARDQPVIGDGQRVLPAGQLVQAGRARGGDVVADEAEFQAHDGVLSSEGRRAALAIASTTASDRAASEAVTSGTARPRMTAAKWSIWAISGSWSVTGRVSVCIGVNQLAGP